VVHARPQLSRDPLDGGMSQDLYSRRYSKPIRKELRRLAGLAHDRELGQHLGKLELRFGAWHAGEIDPTELAGAIHEFHQGPNRHVFVTYQSLKPDAAVARALALGILAEDEVPSSVLTAIEHEIQSAKHIVQALGPDA
jgi:hypothetical protein